MPINPVSPRASAPADRLSLAANAVRAGASNDSEVMASSWQQHIYFCFAEEE